MKKEKNILEVFEELKPIEVQENWKDSLLVKLENAKGKKYKTAGNKLTYILILIIVALNFVLYFEYVKVNSETSDINGLKEIESEFLIKSSSSNY